MLLEEGGGQGGHGQGEVQGAGGEATWVCGQCEEDEIVDEEVERLDMGGVDIHIINPMGEAWVTSLDIATLSQ